jgi:hypothetical protein
MGKILLLSFPRSGNTWVRYIFEFLSKRPTQGYLNNPKDVAPYVKTNLGVDQEAEPIIRKSHQELWPECDRMIFLLRDYKEAIVRDAKHLGIENTKDLWQHFQKVTRGELEQPWKYDYIFAINQFEAFQGPKTLVYYEDLIVDPKKTITRMIDWSGIDKQHLEEFLENYEDHRQKSVSDYQPGSHSGGTSRSHHAQQLPRDVRKQFTTHIARTQPKLFSTYLRRYM